MAGVTAALSLAPLASPGIWLLVGWDVAAVVYLGWVWRVCWPCNAEETCWLASREGPTRAVVDILLISAAVVSLGAVRLALIGSGGSDIGIKGQTIGLGLITVTLSWLLVNTVFTLRYARLYYGDERGGIGFNQEELPQYSDFAYVAFTSGMTFQVPGLRHRPQRHRGPQGRPVPRPVTVPVRYGHPHGGR